MNTVTRTADPSAGTPGISFATQARPGSPEEGSLQRIQAALSGGADSPPGTTNTAHLALNTVQVVDGTSYPIITLWVPEAQESEAVAALETEGFDIEGGENDPAGDIAPR
ncbi:MAG TPA: hypothetical protein VF557_04115 [Jatrophihabitans sp.]|uniref:hypothetical protein n=1 Tax=Jatrophihabitans sp. TaxID=1932789 RepID=UPI002F21EBDE